MADTSYIRQAVMVWTDLHGPNLSGKVQQAIKGIEENAEFEKGMPRTYVASYDGPASIVVSVHDYRSGGPISPDEFDAAFWEMGMEKYDGVLLTIGPRGVTSDRFGGY